MRHAQRTEDFALAKHVERFIGQPFKGDAENNKADVAVFGARAGSGGERQWLKAKSQQFFAS